MRFNPDNTKIWNYTENAASLLTALLKSIEAVGIGRTALFSVNALRIIGPYELTELLVGSIANRALIRAGIETVISDLNAKELEIWVASDLLDERKRIESVDSFASLLPAMISGKNPTLTVLRNRKEVLEIRIRSTRIQVEIFDIDQLADANIDIPFSESWPIFRKLVTKGKSFRDYILQINPDSGFVPAIRGSLALANDLGIKSFRISSFSARARKDELVVVGDFSDDGIIIDVRKIPPFSEAPLGRYLAPLLSIAVKTLRKSGVCENEAVMADAMNNGTTTGLDLMPILSSMPAAMEKIYRKTGFNMSMRISDIIAVNTPQRKAVANG